MFLELSSAPSPWVVRWAPQIRAGGEVLDVACGSGRHTRLLVEAGFKVQAVDRDIGGVADLAGHPRVVLRQADLENAPWPYAAASFDGIVVTRYLHRPLFPRLCEALRPGGVLIYETFMLGQQRYGRPRNPAYLLRPGELRTAISGDMKVLAYEEALEQPPALMQRLCAVVVASRGAHTSES